MYPDWTCHLVVMILSDMLPLVEQVNKQFFFSELSGCLYLFVNTSVAVNVKKIQVHVHTEHGNQAFNLFVFLASNSIYNVHVFYICYDYMGWTPFGTPMIEFT